MHHPVPGFEIVSLGGEIQITKKNEAPQVSMTLIFKAVLC